MVSAGVEEPGEPGPEAARVGEVRRLSAALLDRPGVAHNDRGQQSQAPSREEAVSWPI